MQDLIDEVAQLSYKASCVAKKIQGYHMPGNCPNRFGCEKCRHMLQWELLPPDFQNELRDNVRFTLHALEELGYKILPAWWVGEIPQHPMGAMPPEGWNADGWGGPTS